MSRVEWTWRRFPVGKTNQVRCEYRLVADNLLDLSHVGFVHTSTIGNAGMAEKGTPTAHRTERWRARRAHAS